MQKTNTNFPHKNLIKASLLISLSIGGLIAGVITMVSATTVLSNSAVALVFAGIIFLISLLNIKLKSIWETKNRKKKFFFGISFAVMYFLSFAMTLVVISFTHLYLFNSLFRIAGLAITTFFVIVIVHITQTAIIEMSMRIELELENALLKMKNMEATYQQLKQQVNPHFLFNSLNTLKTLIRKQPDSAEVYLNKLSVFLRKSIEYDRMSVITLEEEINFCMNYIDLQKVRFGDALQFSIHIPEDVKTGFVPVFSIQQLLENAIKHNALTQEAPLFICLATRNNRLIVSNNLQEKRSTETSTGIGLVNLTERYQLLSGDEVIITQEDGAFSVSLKILSHEDCNYRR